MKKQTPHIKPLTHKEELQQRNHIFEIKSHFRNIILFYCYFVSVFPYFTIVQIIFHFLWDRRVHCGIFENGVLLIYTLEGVGSVANFITAYEESQ